MITEPPLSTRAHTVPRFYLGGFVAPHSGGRQDPFVYLGNLVTGEVKRRSPKNVSISRGLYDGPGAFLDPNASVEHHLSQIEWAAASAIRTLAAQPYRLDLPLSPAIWRFLSWQAARTPGWMRLVAAWAEEWDPHAPAVTLEEPPDGFEVIGDRPGGQLLVLPSTGETREASTSDEFKTLTAQGWRWKLRNDNHLEMLHVQAWYFQSRHFPRLEWVRLNAPQGTSFITSDRAVAWIVDGCADAPPSALRDSTAQVVAPLTSDIALVGRHGSGRLNVTPRDINRFIAAAATDWVAGCSPETVEQAMRDRTAAVQLLNKPGPSSE